MWFHHKDTDLFHHPSFLSPSSPQPGRIRTTGLLFVATEETYLASSLISEPRAAGIWAGPPLRVGCEGRSGLPFTLRRGHTGVPSARGDGWTQAWALWASQDEALWVLVLPSLG